LEKSIIGGMILKDKYKEIQARHIKENVFKLIGKDWMLITAGNMENYNMMTASWGGFGILWELKVCFCFIRPTRYTYDFMEKVKYFTICFFDEEYRDVLNFCGTKSGKDVDKMSYEKLTPQPGNMENVFFKESRMFVECRKIYFQDINPEHFLEPEIDKNYPSKDYHRLYIGEIIKVFEKK
jgi:flavin reductase (DIM6/NTAB) family NADH-FMN oxidoreductase RutF